MFGIADLGEYIIGAVAIILLPGPNSMYCWTMAGKYGAKCAYCVIAGILLGNSTLMLFSALGATAVIKTIPVLFLTLKVISGLYLAYLGCGLLREAIYKWRLPYVVHSVFEDDSIPETKIGKATTNFSIFQHALFLNLLNLKAILFFLAFVVQFVDPNYVRPASSFFVLEIILQICSISYLSVLIYSGVILVSWFHHYRRVVATAIGWGGMMYIGFAVKLWTVTVS